MVRIILSVSCVFNNNYALSGDVVLNNLVLKRSALDDLDLPVQIVYGLLGIDN